MTECVWEITAFVSVINTIIVFALSTYFSAVSVARSLSPIRRLPLRSGNYLAFCLGRKHCTVCIDRNHHSLAVHVLGTWFGCACNEFVHITSAAAVHTCVCVCVYEQGQKNAIANTTMFEEMKRKTWIGCSNNSKYCIKLPKNASIYLENHY